MKELDARKLECPKPVLLTKEETEKGTEAIRVCVDNEVAAGNVTRFFESRGFEATRENAGADIYITGVKKAGAQNEKKPQQVGILFTAERIGAASDGLGEVLMKACLGTLAKSETPPAVIALMSGAVKLALPEESTSETLAELVARGTKLLICGTCTNHFGITEQIKIGAISNMFEITEAVFGTEKPVVLG